MFVYLIMYTFISKSIHVVVIVDIKKSKKTLFFFVISKHRSIFIVLKCFNHREILIFVLRKLLGQNLKRTLKLRKLEKW